MNANGIFMKRLFRFKYSLFTGSCAAVFCD